MALALDPRYVIEIHSRDITATTGQRRVTREVYLRRRLMVVLIGLSVAAAACLGVRALASRGDATASIPTVTPLSVTASNATMIDPVVYGQGAGSTWCAPATRCGPSRRRSPTATSARS